MGCSSAKSSRCIAGARGLPELAGSDHTPEKVYSPKKVASPCAFEDRPTDSTTASHREPLPEDLWSLSDR
jgi:hypothetical protein